MKEEIFAIVNDVLLEEEGTPFRTAQEITQAIIDTVAQNTKEHYRVDIKFGDYWNRSKRKITSLQDARTQLERTGTALGRPNRIVRVLTIEMEMD